MPRLESPSTMSAQNSRHRFLRVDTDMVPYKVTFCCFSGAHGAIPLYLPVYLRELGLSSQQIGVVLAPTSLGGFAGGVISGYVSPRFISEKNAFTCGLLLKLCLVLTMSLMSAPVVKLGCETEGIVHSNNRSSQTHGDFTWVYDPGSTFTRVLAFSALSCGLGMCYAGNNVLVDTLTLNALGKDRLSRYGRQRMLGTLCHGIVSFVCGVVTARTLRAVKICKMVTTAVNYHLVFYIYMLCEMGSIVSSRFLGVEQKETLAHPVTYSRRDVGSVFCNIKNGSWLLIVYVNSFVYGVTQGYLFWYLEALGATPFLLGNTTMFKIFVECVVFWCSYSVLQKCNYKTVAHASLICSAFQLVCYSIIQNPIWAVPVQIIEGTAFCLYKCSLMAFTSTVTDGSGMTGIQGVMAAVHCVGTGSGYLVGGWLINTVGGSSTFAICSAMVFLCLCIHLTAHTRPECVIKSLQKAGKLTTSFDHH